MIQIFCYSCVRLSLAKQRHIKHWHTMHMFTLFFVFFCCYYLHVRFWFVFLQFISLVQFSLSPSFFSLKRNDWFCIFIILKWRCHFGLIAQYTIKNWDEKKKMLTRARHTRPIWLNSVHVKCIHGITCTFSSRCNAL